MAKQTTENDKTQGFQNSSAEPINYPDETKAKLQQTAENPSGDPDFVAENEPVKYPKESRDIEFHFTEDELREKGDKLATANIAKARIESEKKQADAGFNERIKAEQAVIDILSKHIDDKYEDRTVTVEVRKNFDTQMREYWYNGVKRGEEPLLDRDHQVELFEEEASPETLAKNEMLLKIVAGDYVMTNGGIITMITDGDVINGIQNKGIERLATQEEINEFLPL